MKIAEQLHAFLWRDVTTNNCNAYLIDGAKKILIDPGHRRLFSHVRKGLDGLGYEMDEIDLVIATHGHPDHLEAAQEIEAPTMFTMGEEEYRFFEKTAGGHFRLPQPNFFLKEGDLNVGDIRLQVIATPGHSPGSVSLYWEDKKALFTGDVIFSRGIGRTDLPGGDGRLLRESIMRLAALDVDYFLPGHGTIVTGHNEVAANFRAVEASWFRYLQ